MGGIFLLNQFSHNDVHFIVHGYAVSELLVIIIQFELDGETNRISIGVWDLTQSRNWIILVPSLKNLE